MDFQFVLRYKESGSNKTKVIMKLLFLTCFIPSGLKKKEKCPNKLFLPEKKRNKHKKTKQKK